MELMNEFTARFLMILLVAWESLAISKYSFLSPWTPIVAYGTSEVVIQHNLGEVPMKVDVEVKVQTSSLGEVIFSATGSAHTGSDSSAQFGGVIYVYNAQEVKIMAPGPDSCTSNCNGGVVYLGGAGYEGSSAGSVLFRSAKVRVKAWKVCDFAKPTFNSNDILLSNNPSKSIAAVNHKINRIPDLVIVQVNHLNGWYSNGQGTAFYSEDPYGGVLFGVTKQNVQLWTPIASANSPGGVFSAKGFGNGGVLSVSAGKVRVFAWKFSELSHSPTVVETIIHKSVLAPRKPGVTVEVTKTISNDQFLVVRAEPSSGTNVDMAFYASGTAPNVADVASSNYYGGIVYGYSGQSVHIWTPSDKDKGCVAFVWGLWGNNHKKQCAKEEVKVTVSLFEAIITEAPCPAPLECFWSVNGPQCNCTGTGMEGQYCESRVKCNAPNDHQNANYKPSKGPFRYQDRLQFSCKSGYEFVRGDSSRTCTAERTWNGVPYVCNPVSCGNPPAGIDAVQSKLTGTKYTDSVTYTCNAGYDLLRGDLVRFCDYDQKWNGSSPVCDKSCGEPEPPTAATRTNTGLTVGAKASYVCVQGYKVSSGNVLRECLGTGQWDGTAPVCTRISCGVPSSGTNSNIQYKTTLFEDVVRYTCYQGYKMVGGDLANTTSHRECLHNKTWSDKPLNCEKIACENLTAPADTVELVTLTGGMFGDYVQYKCITGYALQSGAFRRECQADTTWSGSVPVCTVVTCPVPNQINNGRVYSCGVKYGDKAIAICHHGYALQSGDTLRNCTENGDWSGTEVVCEEVFQVWIRNQSEIQPLKPEEITSLLIPLRKTSRYRRSLISVMDGRTSAVVSGVVASCILLGVVAMFIAIDMKNLKMLWKDAAPKRKSKAQSGTGAKS